MYDSKNLSVLAYADADMFTLWRYQTDDDALTVAEPGYFDNAGDIVRVNDLILATLGRVQASIYVTAAGESVEVAVCPAMSMSQPVEPPDAT